MVWIAFALLYDTSDPPEMDEVAFPLPPDLWTTAAAAHDAVVDQLAGNDYFELTDAHGDVWPFHRPTVRGVATWERT